MKIVFVSFITLLPLLAFSQSAFDLDMLKHPKNGKVLLNGLGGADFQETGLKQINSGAKFDCMFNYILKEGKQRLPFLNFSMKYNPAMWNRYDAVDTFNISDLFFTENKCAYFFGISRFSTDTMFEGGESGENLAESKNFWSEYLNLSYAQYSVNSILPANNGFNILKFDLGGQIGWILDRDIANIMFAFSPFLSYFHVYDKTINDRAFEELLNSQQNLSNDYYGFGAKFIFQLGNYAIHFEGRYYQFGGNYATPPDFATTSFSMGATVQGSILGSKDKK